MKTEVSTEKRHRILVAARKRFAHYGFSKVTMDEIAGDVGLVKSSLYYYYSTKEGLFRAVIAQEAEQFAGDVEELVGRGVPASEMLREYVRVRIRLFRELVNLNALSFTSWSEIQSIAGDLFRNLEKRELHVIQKILMLGTAAGEFSCANPVQTGRLFLHLLHGLRLRVFRGNGGMPVPDTAYEELRQESAHLVDIVIRALGNHHDDKTPL